MRETSTDDKHSGYVSSPTVLDHCSHFPYDHLFLRSSKNALDRLLWARPSARTTSRFIMLGWNSVDVVETLNPSVSTKTQSKIGMYSSSPVPSHRQSVRLVFLLLTLIRSINLASNIPNVNLCCRPWHLLDILYPKVHHPSDTMPSRGHPSSQYAPCIQ